MTSIKQLYSLQELDLAMDSIKSQKAEAEKELNARLALGQIEEAIQEEQQKLEEIQRSHRLVQLEVETLKERSARLDEQLYSGEMASSRDLSSLELEATNARNQVDQKDLQLLQYSVQAEDVRNRIAGLEKELADRQETWNVRHAELTVRVDSLNAELEELSTQRSQLASALDQAELRRYETLRKSKGGQAVAKVERDLCQACRMSLPTQHLQRVRAGRQTVLCSSCGRMLFQA
jgi:uncharacterized protein